MKSLFARAADLEPPARGPFLQEACAQAELCRHVHTLLDADAAAASGFLDGAALAAEVAPPATVGPYRIEAELGRGGTPSPDSAETGGLVRAGGQAMASGERQRAVALANGSPRAAARGRAPAPRWDGETRARTPRDERRIAVLPIMGGR